MNFPEFPGSAFSWRYYILSRNFPAFPWRVFLGPQIAFSGEDEVDMLGSCGIKMLSFSFVSKKLNWGRGCRRIKYFARQKKASKDSGKGTTEWQRKFCQFSKDFAGSRAGICRPNPQEVSERAFSGALGKIPKKTHNGVTMPIFRALLSWLF